MFSSYFFIPADKLKFVDKVPELHADYFIFDMEESVSENALVFCVGNLKKLPQIKDNYSVRISIDYRNSDKSIQLIRDLYQLGFKTFMLPKLNNNDEFSSFLQSIPFDLLENIKFGILVESPSLLIDFYRIARVYKKYISVVLIGSHDYCNTMGCKHTDDNLIYLRLKLLAECKALDLPLVDCVSTDFTNIDRFEEECVASCNSGFDGRAIIHPKQLQAFNNARYYTKEEVREALKVKGYVDKIDKASFSTLNVDGKLYEKPHLKRIYNIAEWHLKHQIYDL